jgi:hypothetical protein
MEGGQTLLLGNLEVKFVRAFFLQLYTPPLLAGSIVRALARSGRCFASRMSESRMSLVFMLPE